MKVSLKVFRRTCKEFITINNIVMFRNKKHKIVGLDYSDSLGDIEIYLQELRRR